MVWLTVELTTIPHCRFTAFPKVLAVDGTGNTKEYGWPLFPLTVPDPQGHIRCVGYGLGSGERQEILSFILESLALCVPSAVPLVECVFSDSALQEHTVKRIFPNAAALLCCWHILVCDMAKNIGRLASWDGIKAFWQSHLRDARTVAAFDLARVGFQCTFPAVAVEYMQQWFDCRHRWVSAGDCRRASLCQAHSSSDTTP